ncbi:hypothetical protein DFH11DRAFT_173496 [Phellopilus nigrolimitatus]|nr:hypothetical protein DFH11DRAFT_173496 [Phellopilus nigrolimitatus]
MRAKRRVTGSDAVTKLPNWATIHVSAFSALSATPMPLLVYASDVRATNERVVLRLKAAHSLLVGELGDASFTLKKPLPTSIDVYSHTDLLVVVSAVLDARHMTSEDVKQSIITRHLVQMFRNNAALLGINNVSNACIDESDGQVKVNITPRRSVPSHNPVSQVALVSIHLTYYCKAVKDSTDSPSTAKYGLTCNLLNQVLGSFITRHVVKRYPLIFGPWGEVNPDISLIDICLDQLVQKLEQEKIYFPSIARSLLSMAQRSPNEEFRIQVKRHLKILSKRLKAAARDVLGDLQNCCSELIEEKALPGSDGDAARTDEDVICFAMERLFKVALRPSLIKCESVIEESLDLTTGEPTNR